MGKKEKGKEGGRGVAYKERVSRGEMEPVVWKAAKRRRKMRTERNPLARAREVSLGVWQRGPVCSPGGPPTQSPSKTPFS